MLSRTRFRKPLLLPDRFQIPASFAGDAPDADRGLELRDDDLAALYFPDHGPGPQGARLDPVVHVVFHGVGGYTHRGSGFLVDDWPGCVITARHNVRRPGSEAVRLELDGRAGGPPFDAQAVAYPDDDDDQHDYAVLWLASQACLSRPMPVAMRIDTPFACTVEGYAMASSVLSELTFDATLEGAFVCYTGPAEGGMSGGPVLSPLGVVGVHQGSFDAQNRGVFLDFDLLGRCLARAAALTS